jgi:8-hydroxy-5-deazaflavin:NADPH oxidoreductase
MKIGILGTGDVGTTLGTALLGLGHDVRLGGREASNPKAAAWVEQCGSGASAGTFAEAAAHGELLVMATFGVANPAVVELAGPDHFAGKVLLDATNPLDFPQGLPSLAFGHTDSAGERLQRSLPETRVVKVFNTLGHAHMVRPTFPGGPYDMLLAGEDKGAKAIASELVGQLGWKACDFGGIEGSRYLEALAVVWIRLGVQSGAWNHVLTVVRR